jgi:type II secretory pathway pseudopilin PulG
MPVLPEAPAKTSGKAVASLILGFFSIFMLPAIVGVVLGHIAWSEIKRSAGKLKGQGLALAGLILGYLGIAALPFVLIIAAIAIPNLLRARQAANEASAVASLRALNTALVVYNSTYQRGFPADLGALRPPQANAPADASAANLIDDLLASGRKRGYDFTYTVRAKDEKGFPNAYSIQADPVESGATGRRHFFTDESGVIRFERDRPARETSPPLTS